MFKVYAEGGKGSTPVTTQKPRLGTRLTTGFRNIMRRLTGRQRG